MLCTTVVPDDAHTDVSSSYSSLDFVLSHWAHFTVHRFICVYFVFLFSAAYMHHPLWYSFPVLLQIEGCVGLGKGHPFQYCLDPVYSKFGD